MEYFELTIQGRHMSYPDKDILISLLDRLGFEGILEDDHDIKAYAGTSSISEDKTEKTLKSTFPACKLNWKRIKERNWNQLWERQFQPVNILDKIYIRAPFHPPDPTFAVEIIIRPQMSFGTGHHETTALMLKMMLELDLKGKSILDMGCGTGILAVAARKMGAGEVLAVDNDPWAYDNAKENIRTNQIEKISVKHGGIDSIKNRSFDIIFANINRNTLLKDIPSYASCLNTEGFLVMSGFYISDLEVIKGEAEKSDLERSRIMEEHDWVVVAFGK